MSRRSAKITRSEVWLILIIAVVLGFLAGLSGCTHQPHLTLSNDPFLDAPFNRQLQADKYLDQKLSDINDDLKYLPYLATYYLLPAKKEIEDLQKLSVTSPGYLDKLRKIESDMENIYRLEHESAT